MIDLSTYFHGILAKMKEKMKIHNKIHDVSTNLGKNPLSLSKNRKNIKKNEEESLKNQRKAIYFAKSVPFA